MPVSHRMLTIRILRDHNADTLIIQLYMPTSYTDEDGVRLIYEQTEKSCEENVKGQVRTFMILIV